MRPDSAVALALLLRATGLLTRRRRHVAVAVATSARSRRAAHALPPVVAAVLETLDARRRRLDAIGT